jgi:DNA-binding NarL/FixJ family response regulator
MAAAPQFQICAETAGVAEARSLFLQHSPALVLMGLTFEEGDGIELIKDLLKVDGGARVLVLSARNDALSVQRALRAGARGYMLTTDEPGEIVEAMEKVAAGGRFASSGVHRCILDDMAYGDVAAGRSELLRLSDRELQVFRGIAAGHGMTQLARQLHLSVKTVETYRMQVKSKLGLHTSAQLRDWAAEWRQSTLGRQVR